MERDIGKIKKNDTTDIVVRIDDFGGRKGLTIREFVTSDKYTGFTKSGVRILGAEFEKFKEMINSVSEEELAGEADSAPREPKAKPKKKEVAQEELTRLLISCKIIFIEFPKHLKLFFIYTIYE